MKSPKVWVIDKKSTLKSAKKEIIGWYEYNLVCVGVNGEPYGTMINYEPIFEGETEHDAKERVKKEEST